MEANEPNEIDFEKYRKRGAYHWDNYFGNVFRVDSFLRGRYDLVIQLLEKSGASESSRILEIGCGDGALSGLIYKRFKCKLYGTEPSTEGIRFCREMFDKHNLKGTFEVVGGYSLPFEDNWFDYIILADVIEHLQHPEKMLAEMHRLLKTGGKAIVTTPIRTQELPEDTMHVKEFFPSELIGLCTNYFDQKSMTTVYSHPVVWHELYSYGIKHLRSLIRLYCRISDKIFGSNLFLQRFGECRWKNFKQQAIVLSK